MDDARARMQQFIAANRAEYARTLAARVAEAESAWQRALGPEAAAEALARLERIGHTLHGTAGTYGLHEVARAGAALEAAVTPLAAGGGDAWPPEARRQVEDALAALRRSLPP